MNDFTPSTISRNGMTVTWSSPLVFTVTGMPGDTPEGVAIFATDTEAASAWLALCLS